MGKEKKPERAVQFVADAVLSGFVGVQAKKKPTDSLVQLLNMVLMLPKKKQDDLVGGAAERLG